MRQFTYPAKLKQDDEGRYLVTFPDFPEALTDGATIDEALFEAADALDEAMAARISHEEEIPEPSKLKRGQYEVPAPALISAKAALTLAAAEANMSKSELARRLNLDVREARRIFDPHHQTKMSRIEEALATVGMRLETTMRAVNE